MSSDGQPVFRPFGLHNVTAPRLVKRPPDPGYNRVAAHAGLQGQSLIQVVVNSRGETEQPKILRPLGVGLDDAAVEAVSHWHFEPAMRDGKPVVVVVQIEVNFRQ